MSDIALRTDMKPRLIKPRIHTAHSLKLPGNSGRIGYTSDPGSADIFTKGMIQTNLRALVRDPEGKLIAEYDLGSGKVTNVGVLALAHDSLTLPGVSTTPVNLFNLLKWHAWGTGTTEAVTDISLTTLAAPTVTEGVEGVTTLSTPGNGKPKTIKTAKIKAESTLAITEWGIHNRKEIKPAEETATAATATTLTATGTPYTASSTTVQGLVGYIVLAKEAEEVWGFISKNTTSVITVDSWYKKTDGTAGATPSATSKYRILPVMFDHRKFEAINVVSGNEIEFPWELTFEAGG